MTNWKERLQSYSQFKQHLYEIGIMKMKELLDVIKSPNGWHKKQLYNHKDLEYEVIKSKRNLTTVRVN